MVIGWLVNPEGAAESLGMELLSGIGASTQIGDLSAFFLATAIMIGLAQRPGESAWLYPIGSAALMRTLAWALGHADFALAFILFEVGMTFVLVVTAILRADERSPVPAP